MTVPLPDVDWEIWRIVSSPRFAASGPNVIQYTWSMVDLVDAHAVLDMYEALEAKARAK